MFLSGSFNSRSRGYERLGAQRVSSEEGLFCIRREISCGAGVSASVREYTG